MKDETQPENQMPDEWWEALGEWVTNHPVWNDDELHANVDLSQSHLLLQIINFQYERLEKKYREMAEIFPDAEKRSYLMEQLAILKYGDDIARGQKVRVAASEGHAAVHGTADEKARRWANQQTEVEIIRSAHPAWSWEEVTRLAAKNLGIAQITIKRHCIDPKKLDQSGQ